LTEKELDSRYEALLEEQYLLKKYANLDLFEQNQIPAEDRRWWLDRIKRDQEEEKERAQKA